MSAIDKSSNVGRRHDHAARIEATPDQASCEREELLQLAAGVAGLGLWDYNPVTDETYWSDRTKEIYGLPADAVASTNLFLQLIHPGDAPSVLSALVKAFDPKETGDYHVEFRLVRPDGEERWVVGTGKTYFGIRNGARCALRFIGAVMDITDRKRTEHALRLSEERFRMAVQCSSDFVCERDIRSGTLTVYGDIESHFGYPPGTFQFTAAGWLNLLHPEDQSPYLENLQTACVPGRRFEMEYRLRRHDGTYADISESAMVTFDESGAPVKSIGTCCDISERKRAEEKLRDTERKFRALFESNILGVVVSNRDDGRILDANDEYLRIIGRTRSELEAGLLNWKTITPPDMLLGEEMLRVENIPPFEKVYIRPDGRCVPVILARVMVGDFGRSMAVVLDNTEQKNTQRQLHDLNETLEQRVREKTKEVRQQARQLRALARELSRSEQRERKRLATILHDHIQQLLVAARMELSALKRSAAASRRAAVDGVDELIREAIEASRSLTIELSPPILQQAGLVAALEWLVQRLAEKHGFAVILRAGPGVEPANDELRTLLFECVRELLFNAFKHSGKLEATLTLARTARGEVKIVVEDQGVGFDPDKTANQDAERQTFGLFSIQQRLAWVGGHMAVSSRPGRGARIACTAPLGEEPPALVAGVSVAGGMPAAIPLRAGRAGPIRVLLVDDHKIFRDALTSLLQVEPDIQVVGQATDGREAVELAVQLDPDVVVMDVGMKGINGIEATRLIVSKESRIRVIGLSMHGESEAAAAMYAAGAVAYLTKGCPAEQLLAAVRGAANR